MGTSVCVCVRVRVPVRVWNENKIQAKTRHETLFLLCEFDILRASLSHVIVF